MIAQEEKMGIDTGFVVATLVLVMAIAYGAISDSREADSSRSGLTDTTHQRS